VSWDEKSANGAVPDHPAPVLQLAAAAGLAALVVAVAALLTARSRGRAAPPA
jgi:hypothetical protein